MLLCNVASIKEKSMKHAYWVFKSRKDAIDKTKMRDKKATQRNLAK